MCVFFFCHIERCSTPRTSVALPALPVNLTTVDQHRGSSKLTENKLRGQHCNRFCQPSQLRHTAHVFKQRHQQPTIDVIWLKFHCRSASVTYANRVSMVKHEPPGKILMLYENYSKGGRLLLACCEDTKHCECVHGMSTKFSPRERSSIELIWTHWNLQGDGNQPLAALHPLASKLPLFSSLPSTPPPLPEINRSTAGAADTATSVFAHDTLVFSTADELVGWSIGWGASECVAARFLVLVHWVSDKKPGGLRGGGKGAKCGRHCRFFVGWLTAPAPVPNPDGGND